MLSAFLETPVLTDDNVCHISAKVKAVVLNADAAKMLLVTAHY